MKEELEAIWNKNEIASPMHITGWIEKKNAIRLRKSYYSIRLSDVLVAIKCRKVKLKLKSRKATIRKHQRLG